MSTLHANHRRTDGTRRARAAFVREFLRDPAATASLIPSSRKLTERMIEGIDLPACTSIVSYSATE